MNSDIENRDWLNEYPELKQVGLNNPFTVPAGYFDGLERDIVSCVTVNDLAPPHLKSFSVPDGYFDELSSNILSRINVGETVDAANRGFALPENYFDSMAAQISSRIAIDEAVKHPFTAPPAYFEAMHAQINSRIAIDESLNSPFTVPDNYFDELSRNVLNQTAGLEAIRKKGVVKKLVTSASFKYATAACFAMIVGAGIFISQFNNSAAEHNRSYLHKALSEVPGNDIEGYLQLRIDASVPQTDVIDQTDKNNINTISADDLKDYLTNN